MARLIEQTVTITISKMVPTLAPDYDVLLPAESMEELKAVIGAIAGHDVLVEIESK